MTTFAPHRCSARGIATVLALLLIMMVLGLGAVFFNSTCLDVAQASNLAAAGETRLAAESGLAFLARRISTSGVSGYLRGQELLDALAADLKTARNGTPNLTMQVGSRARPPRAGAPAGSKGDGVPWCRRGDV